MAVQKTIKEEIALAESEMKKAQAAAFKAKAEYDDKRAAVARLKGMRRK